MPETVNWQSFRERIHKASSAEEVNALEHEIFGRKAGALTLALKELAGASPDVLRQKGKELNHAKNMLSEAIVEKRVSLAAAQMGSLAEKDVLDVTLDLPPEERGHLHLIPEFIQHVEEVFGRMGFDVAEGPEVETEDFNFNFLNIPETHAARDAQATFNITMDQPAKKP